MIFSENAGFQTPVNFVNRKCFFKGILFIWNYSCIYFFTHLLPNLHWKLTIAVLGNSVKYSIDNNYILYLSLAKFPKIF